MHLPTAMLAPPRNPRPKKKAVKLVKQGIWQKITNMPTSTIRSIVYISTILNLNRLDYSHNFEPCLELTWG
jgi:hypothetical protein